MCHQPHVGADKQSMQPLWFAFTFSEKLKSSNGTKKRKKTRSNRI